MAKNVALGLVMLSVLLVIAPMVSSNSGHPRTKQIILFVTVINEGPNINLIPVAGNPNNPIIPTKFGTVAVFDGPLRKSVSRDSPVIGQSQGVNVISSINGTQAFLSFSLVFSDGEYKGSTLELQGIVNIAGETYNGEVAVVSGTKGLGFSSGYASVELVFLNPAATNEFLQKLQIYLKYDHN